MGGPVFIDLETRSACDLREAGSYAYAKHPTTRLLTVAWQVDGEDHVWLPGLLCPPQKLYADLHLPGVQIHVGERTPPALCRVAGRLWVGHNTLTFDRLVWAECTEGFEHVRWADTYPRALAAGMPGGLDKIGIFLWGEGKYTPGKQELKKASRATCLDDCEPENVPVTQLLMVAKYNVQDVRLTKALWDRLEAEARLDPHEARVLRAHDASNTRGVRIDRPLVVSLVNLAAESKERAIGRIAELTHGALPDKAAVQSRKRVLDWLTDMGLPQFADKKMSDGRKVKGLGLRKELVARFIDAARKAAEDEDEPEDTTGDLPAEGEESPKVQLARIVNVLELRMQALRITGGKLDSALHAMDEHHRARGLFVYWGAHTGRWAGRKIQVQNLPRPKDGIDTWGLLRLYERWEGLTYDNVLRMLPTDARGVDGKLLYPFLSVDDAASALIRNIFIPDDADVLAAADYASIESRVLKWCTGDKTLMKVFWEGDDPYLTMAERIVGPRDKWPVYNDPKTGKPLPIKKHPYRQIVGKVPELAAGYQVGGPKLTMYAAAMGFDLSDYGVTGEDCVLAYRKAYPAIAGEYEGEKDGKHRFHGGLWYDLNQAVLEAIGGNRTYAGKCVFFMSRGNLICQLPSGRCLTYRKAAVVDVQDRVPWDTNGRPVFAATYWSPRYGLKYLYGGAIAENIVQAISRDALAAGLVRLEDAGLPVVLHVHDELVTSTRPERHDEFMRHVTTCPDWLDDFPLDAEGGLSPRYSKSPPPGTKEQVWRNGSFLKGA